MDAKAFSVPQRRDRQNFLLDVYTLQRSLGTARRVARGVVSQGEEATRARSEVDRLIAYTLSLMRAVESFNAPVTADHRQQLAWARADAAIVTAAITRLTETKR
jgi:hypothetical protein